MTNRYGGVAAPGAINASLAKIGWYPVVMGTVTTKLEMGIAAAVLLSAVTLSERVIHYETIKKPESITQSSLYRSETGVNRLQNGVSIDQIDRIIEKYIHQYDYIHVGIIQSGRVTLTKAYGVSPDVNLVAPWGYWAHGAKGLLEYQLSKEPNREELIASSFDKLIQERFAKPIEATSITSTPETDDTPPRVCSTILDFSKFVLGAMQYHYIPQKHMNAETMKQYGWFFYTSKRPTPNPPPVPKDPSPKTNPYVGHILVDFDLVEGAVILAKQRDTTQIDYLRSGVIELRNLISL
ncbi:hypothetical protein ACFL6U_21840 [Planctomycetota bacterium]